ncbi:MULTISPECIES: sugar ABC transporter permease [Variovorax]|jgi:D-xylose transport system permease protein|uniref:sugar ABC transporter permease n=1 Tax=Variovorax TaxID=34072 RepID=UPI000899B84D|nr:MULTISPECIES: ABC transporter permease [Variovorax]MDQ0085157.1 D-xylose transport system permease protein [Variovorax boronicumulans]SDY94555.1 D-xylose transport system permease protein [Variovorax sp. YR266]SET35786.1 D-xylose transport system permease protein [Variovorax sp. OV084]SOD22992.1 D-xylose transport system permease protein [Variovorax sp. YR752]
MSNPTPGWWRRTGIDLRLILMCVLLAVMAVVFSVMSGGVFLSPENLYNVAQQTAVVGIVSTVMVLVIVARHIDLSVGSVMGFVGVLIAYLQYTSGWSWPTACLAGLAVALLVSIYQGWLTAVLGVPSFVVTLGGLMSFRGAAFLVADGKTQPVNDEFFQRLGGGYDGGIGVTASWVLAAIVALVLFGRMLQKRRARQRYDMPTEALWLDVLITAVPVAVVIAFAWVMNNYQISSKSEPQGIPIPVLIWAVVAIVLSFIVHRTRFGRYVFAMGGNPDAAALVGIPVKRVTLMLFALLAVLVTIAAIVSIARLNAGTNSLGTGMELYVIAAAVIGGTALAGGSGSIFGSVLGALIMQSLDSGMLLLDVPIGKRMVIIGQVLIVAVVFDVLYRRKFGEN